MIIFLVLPAFGLNKVWRIALLLALLAASFIPLGGLSLAAYLRSHIDDLAITSLVFMGWGCLRRLEMLPPAQKDHIGVLILFAVMALVLYPATLGLSDLDPYRRGFSPRPLLFVIAMLTFGAFYLRNYLAVVMLTGATLTFIAGLKPSHNYWDYLIDPLLGLYCCLALLVLATRWAYRRLITQRSPIRNKSV
jgi:ABC-type branched-subunit amino acid transport system permease subunit